MEEGSAKVFFTVVFLTQELGRSLSLKQLHLIFLQVVLNSKLQRFVFSADGQETLGFIKRIVGI